MLARHRDDEISRSKLMFVKLACDVFARSAVGERETFPVHTVKILRGGSAEESTPIV